MPGQNAASEETKTLDSAPVSMCTSTSQPYLRRAKERTCETLLQPGDDREKLPVCKVLLTCCLCGWLGQV